MIRTAREIEDMSRQAETALMEIDAMARGALPYHGGSYSSAVRRLASGTRGLALHIPERRGI